MTAVGYLVARAGRLIADLDTAVCELTAEPLAGRDVLHAERLAGHLAIVVDGLEDALHEAEKWPALRDAA